MPPETAPAPVAPAPVTPTPAPTAPPNDPHAPLAPGYVAPADRGTKTPEDRKFTPGKFDDLDTLGDEPVKSDEPPKGPTPAPTGEPPKGPAPAAPAKPVEPELDSDGVPKVKTNKELRQWAVAQGKSAKEALANYARMEARVKELETAAKTGNTEEQVKQLAKLQAQVEEYETKLRYTNYQQSREYRDKYETPLNDAIQSAYKFVEELRVEETDADSGEIKSRPATAQDFNRLYNLDRADARALAKSLFGDDANEVMQHRAKIRELSDSAAKASEDYRKNGQELETQRTIRSKQEREATAQMWRDVNEDLGKKFPHWFRPADGDDEGNKALEKGYQLVDSALGDERSKMTLQERVIADAHIRNRAAGFTRLVIFNKRLKTALDEAVGTIEKMRKSSPGGKAATTGAGQPAKRKTWEEAMDEAMPE